MKKPFDVYKSISTTNQDYIDRMEKENKLKNNVKEMIRDQLNRVENTFEDYQSR